ncbi:hypothetical protein BTO20_15870 [Mycobacterium dioxanotrophicus]|uniref:Uncharacterized protein n=1 Tax=Mycobacterium dioxanotrophicus TaxID=482462 RepID=A0A1Y0C3T4_9MYCO|nr:hypothetical protein [Mycobacterium dioxanotrophicus]ART69863.1 hypothetical protein BTO20_15870 [Mycobacterium dioxanotrophicus]
MATPLSDLRGEFIDLSGQRSQMFDQAQCQPAQAAHLHECDDTAVVTASKALVRSIVVGAVHPGSSSCRCQRSRGMIRARSATKVLAMIY